MQADTGFKDPIGGSDTAVRIVIEADMMAVRHGLQDLLSCPPLLGLSEECRGTTEIVLAEALNNVVEHAYAQYSGQIEVAIRRWQNDLLVDIADSGLPMPSAELPAGNLDVTHDAQDTPEGGFGWFLIRTLSHNLNYSRVDNLNRLSFCLSTNSAA